jgi:hypothetical protein
MAFFATFFDLANNKPKLLPYDFVLIQGGKQLQRVPSITQAEMNVRHYVFSNSGPITVRIENVGAVKSSDIQFNAIVFDNPNISSAAANQLAAAANRQSNNPFTASYSTIVFIEYAVIFGIPAGGGHSQVLAYYSRGQADNWDLRCIGPNCSCKSPTRDQRTIYFT